MHLQDEIVDRDIETETLIEDINANNGFTVNILYAPTAIGKSSVTIKLSKKLQNCAMDCITVRTNPINTTVLSEWTFVNCLFEELKNAYQNTIHSFESFINLNEHFLNLKARNEFDILKDLSKENALFKSFLIQQMSNCTNVMDILLENEKQFLYAKQEYIYYIFGTKMIVLIIDNLQIIDNYSLEFFRRCFDFNSLRKHYVIFEYTENNNSYEVVLRLSEYFKSDNIKVKCTPIEKTNSCYIADIIDRKLETKPKDFQFNYDLINHYIESNTGNIRELIDFSLNYCYPESTCKNKTVESVIKLNEIELYILFVLLEFDGCIKIESLNKLSNYANIINYEKNLQHLIQKHLIRFKDNEHIAIEHASITDALKTNHSKLIVARNTTINVIKSYVESLLTNTSEEIYPFLRVILNIYKEQSPLEIFKLLKYIEDSILLKLQPLEAWQYFSAFIAVTNDKITAYIPLYITIFKLCFKFELYKEGFSCLEQAYPYFDLSNTSSVIVYRMLYLAALDKHQENIDYFISMQNYLLKDERLYLNANLAVLSSYRSLGDDKSCLLIHKKLRNHRFKKYIEYGYRNRLVDMYLSRAKSIKYLRRSLKNFEAQNQIEQVAKTLITYTHVLGGLGKINDAKRQIIKAEFLLDGKILGKHMIFVNKAVLNLVDGNFDVDTYRMLDMAETSVIVPFDKLAIIVNKLAWCYENNRYDLVHVLTEKAETLLPHEPDKHVHALLYFNLYVNYNKEGNIEKANKYLCRAKETMRYCEPVKARILNQPTKETKFILGKPWHICYLTYWTFDVLLD